MHRSLSLLVAVAALVVSAPASAFKYQRHIGGGVGFASFAEKQTSTGPAFGVHGAYGLSDVFDVKLDVLSSLHSVGDERLQMMSVTAGLAYKMDVIRWVPYAGLQVGYYRLEGDERPGERGKNEPGFSVDLGLDYAVKRSFGLGLQLRYHGFLSDPFTSLKDAPFFTGLVRAEYRWGW